MCVGETSRAGGWAAIAGLYTNGSKQGAWKILRCRERTLGKKQVRTRRGDIWAGGMKKDDRGPSRKLVRS
jgi:hypothetical protein